MNSQIGANNQLNEKYITDLFDFLKNITTINMDIKKPYKVICGDTVSTTLFK